MNQESAEEQEGTFPRHEEVQIVFSAHSTNPSIPVKSTLLSSSEVVQSQTTVQRQGSQSDIGLLVGRRRSSLPETDQTQDGMSPRQVSSEVPLAPLATRNNDSNVHGLGDHRLDVREPDRNDSYENTRNRGENRDTDGFRSSASGQESNASSTHQHAQQTGNRTNSKNHGNGTQFSKKGVVIDAIALLLANNLELAKNKSELINGTINGKNSTISEESVRKINATLNFIRSLRDNVTLYNNHRSKYRFDDSSGRSSGHDQNQTSPKQVFEIVDADDLMTSENTQSILTTTAKNIASWIRDSFFGSKLFRNRNTEIKNLETSNAHYLGSAFTPNNNNQYINYAPQGGQLPPPNGQFSMNGMPYGHPPPLHLPGTPPYAPNHFIPNFVPPPEGFPSPFSPDSMAIPPEFLQDTGIDYWLNFIESAAPASADKDHTNTASSTYDDDRDRTHIRPIKIGEKPSKAINSIRDEIIDDGHVYQRKNSGHNPPDTLTSPSRVPPPVNDPVSSDNTSPRCDKFTAHICVDDFEYPEQAIVDEIYKRKDMFELMYSGDIHGHKMAASSSGGEGAPSSDGKSSQTPSPPLVDGIPKEVEESYVYETYDDANGNFGGQGSASSTANSGYVCPSEVLHGKPKLARNMNGDWKVIVNAVSLIS